MSKKVKDEKLETENKQQKNEIDTDEKTIENGQNDAGEKIVENEKKEEQKTDNKEVLNDQYEEKCFSKYANKKIKRLRKKGTLYGIKIPYLNCDLTKRSKPRISFLILAIFSMLFLAVVLALSVVLTVKVIVPWAGGAGELASGAVKSKFDIVSFFAGLTSSLVWIIVFFLIFIIIFLIVFAIKMFNRFLNLAKCSEEEMAMGFEPKMLKRQLIFLSVSLGVMSIIFITNKNTILLGVLILVIMLLIIGAVLGILIYERKKSEKVIKEMPEEKREYLEGYFGSLFEVMKKISSERSFYRFWR